MYETVPKLRVVVWCDYHTTLLPTSGIGVFVDNLCRGLMESSRSIEITLVASPGESELLTDLVKADPSRIRAVSASAKLKIPRRVTRLMRSAIRRIETSKYKIPLAHFFVRQIQKMAMKLDREYQRFVSSVTAEGDVVFLPTPTLEQDFSIATVVAVHDLIPIHFPEMMGKRKTKMFYSLVQSTVEKATTVVCMSQFIKNNDIIRLLGVPCSRIRVIRGAVPVDAYVEESSEVSVPTDPPYLLYPAAFRLHKNHGFLIRGLALLRRQTGVDWNVVFTGQKSAPKWIRKMIREYGLENHVRITGTVSRDKLRQLYASAFATIVPSLYEQGSFPALESIASGCPVAVSNIDAFREFFHDCDSIPLFDPSEPVELIRIVHLIGQNRADMLNRQGKELSSRGEYTWRDAATHWSELFFTAAGKKSNQRTGNAA
jgi:glycosyltransferase involved in cell wall biosynthesis